jgi:hypothetical protein
MSGKSGNHVLESGANLASDACFACNAELLCKPASKKAT